MKKILVADDEEQNRVYLETLFQAHGFQVTSVPSGAKALGAARKNPPHIIISDILMPEMDGFMLCREWKNDSRLKKIPFVFYTATYTDPQDEKLALDMGADLFIIKPQEPDVILDLIQKVMAKRKSEKKKITPEMNASAEVVMKEYNEALFRKLEKKLQQLETSNQQLRILEEKYRLSFEQVTDVIYTIDTDLKMLSVSPSVEKILGYKPQDFIGRPFSDLGYILTPESFERIKGDISLVLKGEKIPAMVYLFIAKDGTMKHGEVSSSTLMREGKIIGIISVARDITERINTERKMFESEQKYRMLVENSSETIFIAQEGMLKFINRAAVNLFGSSYEVITSSPFSDFIHPDDQEMVISNHFRRLKGEAVPDIYTFRIITPKGTVRWVEIHATIIPWQGKPATLNFVTDVTEHRQFAENLRLSEHKFRTLFENSAIGTAQIEHATGKIIELNQKLCTITGYSRNELIAETFEKTTHRDDVTAILSRIRQLRAGLIREFDLEIRCLRKDGSCIFVNFTATPLWSAGEEPSYYIVTVQDINERKQAEKAIKDVGDYLNQIINRIGDPLFVKDQQLRFVLVNEALCTFLGKTREELIGTTGLEYLPKEEMTVFEKQDKIVFETGKESINEENLTDGEGKIHTIVTRKTLYTGDGVNKQLVGVIRDITERKKAEDALRKSEQQQKVITDNIQDTVWLMDMKYRTTWINPSVTKTMGYTPEEIVQIPLERQYKPDSLQRLRDLVLEHMTAENLADKNKVVSISGEFEFYRKNGDTFLGEITISILRAKDGKPIGFMGVGRDITRRRQMEMALQETQKLLHDAYNLAEIGSWSWDAGDKTITWSEELYRMAGLNGRQLNFHDTKHPRIYTPYSWALLKKTVNDSLKTGKSYQVEVEIIHPDGNNRWLNWIGGVIYDQSGKITGMHGTAQNITRRKQAEDELQKHREHLEQLVNDRTNELTKANIELFDENNRRKAIEEALYIAKGQAEEANQAKSDFLANMSHELRTPLNSVIGFSEVLQNQLIGQLNEKQKEYVQFILGSGKHLLNLINDILDLSKVEAGKMELSPQIFSLKDMLNGISMMFREKALNHTIHINMEIAADIPEQIYADERKIKQIMFNLLGNAMKFTPDGGSVKITAKYDKNNNSIVLAVEDTGIGIKTDDLTKIFEPFSQIESPYTKTKTGTGLGLAITKRMAELHGGAVKMESEWGKGSKVTVTIAMKRLQR